MSRRKSDDTEKRNVLVISSLNSFQLIQSALPSWLCFSCGIEEPARALSLINDFNIRVILVVFDSPCHQQLFASMDKLHHKHPSMKWIAIVEKSQLDHGKTQLLLPEYFHDYHHFPIDAVRLSHTLGHAYGLSHVVHSTTPEKHDLSPLDTIVGNSPAIMRFKEQLALLANSPANILITGETGTGKDLAALAIHQLSHEKNSPFINVNCASFPEQLIHSELFGHEKGAFTGAINHHKGKIEQAQGGTLFLNEIGDLPINLQVTLLKFLDDQMVERIGTTAPRKIDCRIIAATNVDLSEAIQNGKFREDLYYRLGTIVLNCPPLRDRGNDVFLLCEHLIKSHAAPFASTKFSSSLKKKMLSYHWHGNVRELTNRLTNALVIAGDRTLTIQDFGFEQSAESSSSGSSSLSDTPETDCAQRHPSQGHAITINKQDLISAIKANHYNISATARSLNISRTTCYRLMKKCDIEISNL